MTALDGSAFTGPRRAPLAALAGPAPGRVVALVAEDVPPPSRALAARWAPSGIVRCPTCAAPIRPVTWDAVRALLGDVEPTPADEDCVWCGPAGVRRWLTEALG